MQGKKIPVSEICLMLFTTEPTALMDSDACECMKCLGQGCWMEFKHKTFTEVFF